MARGEFQLVDRQAQLDDDEEFEAAKQMFGIVIADDAEQAESSRQPEEKVFFLLPENEPAWRLWLQVQTQWRVGPAGYPTGMDYSGVVARMGRVSIRRQHRMLDEIQLMEMAALQEFAKKRNQQKNQRGA